MSLFSPLLMTRMVSSASPCDYHVQVAHVQDATSTFINEIDSLKNQNLVKGLIDHLVDLYGKVDYAITSFQDKPLPITGFGKTGGWWDDDSWAMESWTDQCYSQILPFTSNPEVANAAFQDIVASGGKDFMENQWDALRRTAIDPTLGWDLRTHDDDGSPIVRIAILITDDAAHTAPTTFEDNVRNINREYFKMEGPFTSYSEQGSTTQKCDLSGSLEIENNIRTNHIQSEIVDGEGGACFGWSAAKAGVTRSLKGTLGYLNYFYGFGESPRLIDSMECPYYDMDSNPCWEYAAFVNCCTAWGVSTNQFCPSDFAQRFPDYDACVAYGGEYARCHASLSDKYGIANEWPANRHVACTTETEEWLVAKEMEPSPEFWQGLGLHDQAGPEAVYDRAKDLEDYPHDESIFDKDCATFEYPDPKSNDYAQAFLERGIIPIIVAAPPSDKYKVTQGADPGQMSSYDYHALRMSEHNCPGLEYDPWTSYFCQASKPNSSWYCYVPHEYPELFPNQDTWESNVPGERWYETELGCDDDECAKKWWSACMDVEYGEPVRALNDHGVTAYYQEMDANFDATVIVARMEQIIERALEDKGCRLPSTTSFPTLIPTIPTDATSNASSSTDSIIQDTTTQSGDYLTATFSHPSSTPSTSHLSTSDSSDLSLTTTMPHDPMPTPPTPIPPTATNTEEDSSNLGTIIGSSVGGTVVVIGAIAGVLAVKGVIPGFKSSKLSMITDQNVNVITDPNEREQIAEVDNMFL